MCLVRSLTLRCALQRLELVLEIIFLRVCSVFVFLWRISYDIHQKRDYSEKSTTVVNHDEKKLMLTAVH